MGFAGSARPANAVDLLWLRLGASHEGASFARVGGEIVATLGDDAPASRERGSERAEVGRRTFLNIVIGVCGRAPELESDWYAVSPER